jgi:hypothetical protein
MLLLLLKQNSNSQASGTHDSDMLLILVLSILGSLKLLEDNRPPDKWLRDREATRKPYLTKPDPRLKIRSVVMVRYGTYVKWFFIRLGIPYFLKSFSPNI